MRIHVECRDGNPRAFYLGTRWLYITYVVERAIEPSERRFRVKVGDGRVFVLHHNVVKDNWELESVNWHASPRHTAA